MALALISTVQLMVVLDATIVTIALPKLRTGLGFSPESLAWVLTSYSLAFGGLLLLGGRLGDLLGRRRVFALGAAVFAVASLLGTAATNPEWMIASRALQGVGAAMASPAALALITTTFPAGPQRNRAMGVYAAMSGLGSAVGLLLGGVLTEISWRLTFFINVPIGAVVALLAARFLIESQPKRGSFDLVGALTATVGLAALVYGFTRAGGDATSGGSRWSETGTLIALGAGVLLLAVFILAERRSAGPLLPLRILRSRTRGVSYCAMLIVSAAMFSFFMFLSQYAQDVLDYSSLQTGVAFMPFAIFMMAASQLSSFLVSKFAPARIAGVGALLAAAGMYWYSLLEADSTYWAHVFPPMPVTACGFALMFIPLTLTALHGVGQDEQGVTSAVLNSMQQVGGALGIAVLSTVWVREMLDKQAELAAGAAAGDMGRQAKDKFFEIAFTEGAGRAFLVVGIMLLGVAALIVFGLRIKQQELTTDGEPTVAAEAR
ncbi:DHA2 family efflux MFS transporter permease subunit [Streptomyces sp. HC44]|uniref:DHA2 family efflux MFS transporter permease subunit n=1 Tax=Streptomyces scabichelini TaxID=2711217 RepID=A0A6G4V1K6_9ACTN|nr:DHA2 family efflux MFS transporter permease subunit [Streptomyces scabichelini]NGO07861.1 DHA2 family efflux MFS transporter permease subunit [Streptomyces scabichelini]